VKRYEPPPGWSVQAYRFALDPTDTQVGGLRRNTGVRKGRRMGWPRARRKHGRRSARFTTGAIRVDPGYRHVVLPRLGRIRTHEPTRKLARRVRAGTATILSATVSETAGRWFCSFQVAVKRTVRRPAHAPSAGRVIGMDAGIKHLAVLSTGELVPNSAPLKAALKKQKQDVEPT
jgi:putative transposase